MGLVKVIGIILLLVLVVGLIFIEVNYLKDNYSQTIENLKVGVYGSSANELPQVSASGEVRQFYPNMRFPSEKISYYINPNCDPKKSERVLDALNIISNETNIITFNPASEDLAEIVIGCSKESYQTEKNSFVAGEGGPTKIINSTLYPIILRGKVVLYQEKECDYPITELHELFHVFGFDHVNNSKRIMYPYVSCDQIINPEIIPQIITLYSVPSLPELYFANVSGIKLGKYLNLSIEVSNQGLADAKNVILEIYADGNKIETYDFQDIEYATGKTLEIGNLELPSRNVKNIKLTMVSNEKELNNNNNVVEMNV